MLKSERLEKCLRQVMGPPVPGEYLTPATDIFDDLGMDSIDQVEFTMAIEDEFDLKIDDEVADSLRTWGQYLSMLEKCVREKSAVAGG
jgi:acyl carrier protein